MTCVLHAFLRWWIFCWPGERWISQAKAVADDGLLSLTDERGRKVLVPASRIAYLEIGQEHVRRVGFGAV